MSSWPEVLLGECCEIISGSTPRRDHQEYWGGDIPWVTPKDLRGLEGPVLADTPEKITRAGYESCSTRLLPTGSVLFSSRAPIGLVAITGREMCTNQGFKSLIPGPDVDASYLHWCLKRLAPRIAAQSSGTTFTEISRKGMERVKIPLPPLPEQRRIAAILDKADAVRRKRQQTLDLSDQFLRSAFLDMFGDPVTNPKGWSRMTIKDCAAEIADCPHSTPKWTDEGVICIRTSNLGRGTWQWDDTRFVSEEEYLERSSRGEAMPGDIVLSREGTIGIAAIVTMDMRLCMGQRLVRIRPGSQMRSEYLLSVLLHLLAPGRIARVMVGSTSKHLNVGEFRRMKVPVPPLGVQERYSRILDRAVCLRRKLLEYQEREARLQGALTQRAFRGDLAK